MVITECDAAFQNSLNKNSTANTHTSRATINPAQATTGSIKMGKNIGTNSGIRTAATSGIRIASNSGSTMVPILPFIIGKRILDNVTSGLELTSW